MSTEHATPAIQRLQDWGVKQTLCSENVLKSATLAQLKLLQGAFEDTF